MSSFDNKRSFGNSRNYSRGSRFGFGNNNFRSRGNGHRAKRPIDISSFIARTRELKTNEEYSVARKFTDFDLNSGLLNNIINKGYLSPTPIQDKIIDQVIAGKDVLGIANTGTGKTGSFLIPLINKIIDKKISKILVVCPTRELAVQIDSEFRSLASNLGIYSVVCIGGANIHNQYSGLRGKFNVVIGTPGRLKDMINRKVLMVENFDVAVLDEVDRMLDMGFVKDVSYILNLIKKERQSLFFSATVNNKVNELINRFAKNLLTISVKTNETAATIKQELIRFSGNNEKIETLHKLLISDGFDKVLIFGRTKHGVKKLSQNLEDRGFRVNSIHGNKSQSQRLTALNMFKKNQIKVLVATDVAARGLDICDVSHVINYDVPESFDDYIHRIGRTGRANKQGKALTFVCQS